MKSAVYFSLLFITVSAHTQTHYYEIVPDKETKVLKGFLERSDIESDTAFKWFKQNMQYGRADDAAVNAFKKNSGKFSVIIFAGTWCEDSQNMLPVFYRLADKAAMPADNIFLIGVDRDKATLQNLQKAFNVTLVPAFIVMKDGKEVGRVIEYGKYGQIDKDLGEIVSAL